MTETSDDFVLNVYSATKEKKKSIDGHNILGSIPSLKRNLEEKNKLKKNSTIIDNVKTIKKPQGEGRVSSLFANNPDIPVVKHKDVEEITEQVFSENSFENVSIHPFVVSNLEQNFNITKTTTVQELSIPVLLSGKDALIRSQTGSGKTLAYAIPIIHCLQEIRPKLNRKDGIKALIVLPTRELALQTYECFLKLVKSFTWLVPGLLIGGEKRKSEKARLRKGITILIGTPGRLVDHCKRTESLQLNTVQWIVLDEADRLLDLGYEKDIASLLQTIESHTENLGFGSVQCDRQTVLLSATLTPRVEQLAGITLKNPERIDASSKRDYYDSDVIEKEHLVIPKSLTQLYIIVPPKLRLVTLASVIHWKCKVERGCGKMLVFIATQDMVDYLTNLLSTVLPESAEYFKLHGSMTQDERTQIFKTFRKANSGVLLCTDVAARGLDLPKVDWIIQFTAPITASDYVHRVGRTARVGHKGSALMFLAPSESSFLNLLEEKLIKLNPETTENCLQYLRQLQIPDAENIQRSKKGGPTTEASATALQLQFETAVVEQTKLHELAAKGYISFVRFYASYPKEFKEVFNFHSLHLGHYAKSFALRDPPSVIGGIGKPKFKKQDKRSRDQITARSTQRKTNPSYLSISEFDSGLTPRKKKKKTD